MWPIEDIEFPGATEIAAPADTGWEGRMGCHDTPRKAWTLPQGWSAVWNDTACEAGTHRQSVRITDPHGVEAYVSADSAFRVDGDFLVITTHEIDAVPAETVMRIRLETGRVKSVRTWDTHYSKRDAWDWADRTVYGHWYDDRE